MRRFIFRVLKNKKKEKTNDRFPILINAWNNYNYQTNRLSFFLPHRELGATFIQYGRQCS